MLCASSFELSAQQSYDNEKVKSEVKTILSDYEKAINALINLPSKDKGRRAFSNKLKNNFESTGVWVYNDLDTNASDTSTLKMFEYIKSLPKYLPFGSQIKLNLDGCRIDDVAGNKERNGYTIKAHIKKTIQSRQIIETRDTIVDLTTHQIDSIIVLLDTIRNVRSEKLTFHFKINYYGYTYKGPKVSAISKWKVTPKHRLLKPSEQWWVDLSPEWKSIFRDNAKLQEFPDKMDLQKIEFIYNLDLKEKNIKTIKPLSRVKQLRTLNLTKNPISSLKGIESNSKLAELYINETEIKDLEPLNKLTSLQILHCKKLELTTLDPIKGMTNLIELNCEQNLLEDINALKNMQLLEFLNISLNEKITSIEPLRNKPNLTKLWMRKMKVTDITAISTCTNMVVLDVFSNEIGTLGPLARLKKLAILDCGFAKISSLQPLAGHRNFIELNCTGNAINDISVMRNFYALKKLNIGRTSVTSLDPIMKLEYLQRIDIFETKITVAEKDRFKKRHPKCKILYY